MAAQRRPLGLGELAIEIGFEPGARLIAFHYPHPFPSQARRSALGASLAIPVEITKRPQTSLLHNIGGIGIVARQPACERIAGVEMRQHHRLEPALPTPLRDPRHVLFYPIPAKTAATAELFRGG